MGRRLITAVTALLSAAACSGGDGVGGGAALSVPPSTTVAASPATTATSAPVGVPGPSNPGRVTFTARGIEVAPGSPLRIVVRPSAGPLTVVRRGGGGALSACPVASVASGAEGSRCPTLADGDPVELAAPGVEIRAAAGGPATVEEVSLSYAAADRATTVVVPTGRPRTCASGPCQATFTMAPAGAGAFSLTGRADGARARLVLSASGGGASGGRVLATAEGSATLALSATIAAPATAVLTHQDLGGGPTGPLTMEIVWP